MDGNQNDVFEMNGNDDAKIVEKKRTRRPFSNKEDQKLRKLVLKFGEKNAWKKIADKMINRNVRQCRERWFNTLSEKVIKTKWTKEEDELLFKKYDELGPKWKKMESFFPGRVQYQIRNRIKILTKRNQQNLLNNEIDLNEALINENDENLNKKEISNIQKNDSLNNPNIKNIFSIFPVSEKAKKSKKLEVNLDDDFFESENFWGNFSY